MWDGGKIIGFVGVDNPRYSIHDDSQVRVLSHFLADRIRQRQNELKLKKMLEFKFHDILDVIGIGLWIIRIDERKNSFEMFSDDTMYRVLGASENITPAECYDFWYSRIGDGYYQYVNESVQNMIGTDKIIQLEYVYLEAPGKGRSSSKMYGQKGGR